jgi:predicted acylesterase/phospholipase RssA
LDDGRVAFEGISGTSAGAMNAVAMAHGFATAEGHSAVRAIHQPSLVPLEHLHGAHQFSGLTVQECLRLVLTFCHCCPVKIPTK